jgi:hypothetical protein
MDIYGLAALVVASMGALAWVLVTALRKVPAVCKEAEKAVRAVRSLRDEIRGQDRRQISDAPPTRERPRTRR